MRAIATILVLLLTACAQPATQPAPPPIREPALEEQALVTRDGARLKLRSWAPRTPRAAMIAVHGFNDYAQAFAMPAPYWERRGVAVYAYDQRGFGRTPPRGIWAGELLSRDLADAVLAVKARHPSLPVFVLGESMGGAVILHALSHGLLPKVDGVILVSPAVWGGLSLNPLYRGLLWLLAHTVPGEKLSGQGLRIQASDNILMLRELGRDPWVIKRTRVDAIYGLVALMDEAYASAPGLKDTPVLMLYGGQDQVIPTGPLKSFAGDLRKRRFTVAYYPQGYHMLLRDLRGREAWEDILSWIEREE